MRCYYSTEHDPVVNLALESALFAERPATPVIILYRCRPAVIIGRNQNPWNEINFSYAHRHRIPIFRRESGGGTVYHDLGNINFSFILPRALHSIQNNLTIVVRALHRLGVRARYTRHNDILVAGRKISGSAFRHKEGHVLHHGTLLCRTQLRHLRGVLRVDPIVTEGVMVRSRPMSVTNVTRYAAPATMRRVIRLFSEELASERYFPASASLSSPPPFTPLGIATLTTEQRALFQANYAMLSGWQWRVAKTPPCGVALVKIIVALPSGGGWRGGGGCVSL